MNLSIQEIVECNSKLKPKLKIPIQNAKSWSDEMNVFTSTIDIFTVGIYLCGRHIIRFCMLMYTIERQVQFGNLTHMFKKIRPQMCA